jgi:Raf kinase inhibitor-like YbhB/YbcL family protein
MIARRLLLLAALAAAAFTACTSAAGAPSAATPITVTSPAFVDGKLIPASFTCIDADTSPPLAWKPKPDGTKAWAIVMEDIDANFVHWVVTGLASKVHSISTNQLPKGSIVSQDSNGSSGYHGPCPPSGKTHHYRITVYALSHVVHVNAKDPTKTALATIQTAAINHGALTGVFSR